MEDFKSRWNGDVFYNNGDESGRGSGVAILTRRDRCGQVKVIYDDGAGKSLAVEMNCEERKTILYKIHAPGEEKKKKDFFNNLRTLISKEENVFIMGDFNTLFSKIDMAEGMVYKSVKGRKELNILIEENDLIDVWRERNEKKREYSRQQIVQNFMCQTRIDFVLIKRALGKYVEKVY